MPELELETDDTDEEIEPTLETLVDNPPEYCEETASLYRWSTNYDAGTGPFTLFLDLIGWSEDELGETMYALSGASLGYVELDYLADALKEYTNRPRDVREYVDALMIAESAE